MGEAKVDLDNKKKEFALHPNYFIDVRDTIFVAIRKNGNVAIMVNQAKESEYGQAMFKIQRKVFNALNNAEMQAMKSRLEIPTNPDDIIGGKQ